MTFGNAISNQEFDLIVEAQTEFDEYELRSIYYYIESFFGKINKEDMKDLKLLEGNIYFNLNGEVCTCPYMHKNDASLYATLVRDQIQSLIKGI